MNHTITVYSTPTCHFCHMAKEYFKSKGWEFTDVNVAGNIEKQKELVAKSGQFGVPVIIIKDKVIVGFDRPKIDKLMQ
ncbi:NrdH-redoxin [Candidatus Roizmanbacteria bacterium RIFCSPHIGHO2_12_FULL_41_11]|uniref:NrdH-redoxin n=2 Tax=Patescibacteria group TaxID=1783273 RepID=A0A1F8H970_9BACT|nr:MAG: NrdH-redoxin [Candidatus Roizmanbacteria bacterium RIFCSPHIGHO2_12_FULL_41_11]OGN34133.1 MAG: NrdH-redoxin [Candidatus Yanofskybacteria bacterium RIFCSPLOWO2_02_FULL_47_9b]